MAIGQRVRRLGITVLVIALGCALEEEPPPVVCEAGRTTVCVCPGGSEATQTCKSNGSGWTACGCPDGSSGSDGGPPDPGSVECTTRGECIEALGDDFWCDGDRCAHVQLVGNGARCDRNEGTACADGLWCDVEGDFGTPQICIPD